jgi:magnesium transporter
VSTDTADPVTHEANHDPHVRTRVWKNGKVLDENYSIEQVSDHLEMRDKLVWVDLVDPDHAMLAKLAGEVSLDANAVEDAIAGNERAKVTDYGRYLFVTAYSTSLDGADLKECRISAFVLPHALVTVHGAEWTGIEEVVKRWDALGAMVEQAGSEALVYGLLDKIVDDQFDTVQAIDDAIDALEEGLFEDKPQSRTMQKQQFDLRRAVATMRKLVLPETQMLAVMRRNHHEHDDHPEMRSNWEDLNDHIARVVDWTDQARDLLNNVFSANMSLQDARLNMVMKKLTAWAAIIAVPTAITGFYGQNVRYPDFGTTAGFIVSSAVILVAMGFLYVLFKKKDWL